MNNNLKKIECSNCNYRYPKIVTPQKCTKGWKCRNCQILTIGIEPTTNARGYYRTIVSGKVPAVIASTELQNEIKIEIVEEMKQYIPQTNGYYINQNFGNKITDEQILQTLYNKNTTMINRALLIEGDTGCGKTHFVRAFCHKYKIPYMRVNLNGATTPEDLIGQYVPSENGFRWVDGVLTKFMKNGGIFVVDEINMAPADVLAILNPILDDERKLVLVQKDGEIIHAHQNFFLIATMNLDYEGTKPLNEALRDRFFCLEFGYNKKAEKQLIKKENTKILEVAEKIRKMHEQGELNSPISTRTLLLFQQNIDLFGFEFALNVLTQRFESIERKAIKEVIELIYSSSNVSLVLKEHTEGDEDE